MKATQIARVRPTTGFASLGGGGGTIDGTPPAPGTIPVATGSNSWSWSSNVQQITANSSNILLSPFVNFDSGTGIAFAVASNTLTISNTGSGSGGSGTFVGAKAYATATQTISTATETVITFDSEEYDTDGFHSTVSNTGRFTVPSGKAGKYLLNAGGLNDGAGAPELRLRINGTTYVRGGDAGSGVTSVRPVTSAVIDLAVGDYAEVIAFQSSGGNATWGHATLRQSQLAMSVTLLQGSSGSGSMTQAYSGYNTIGGSQEIWTAGRIFAKKITLANDCLVTDIQAYVDQGGTGGNDAVADLQAHIYEDNAGTPRYLLHSNIMVQSTSIVLDNVAGAGGNTNPRWFGLAMGRWMTAGDYWIAVQCGSTRLRLYYDATGSDRYITPTGNWGIDWGFQSPTTTANQYSIRANTIR